MKISYHVSHEQFSPRELLELVQHAEAAGFDAAFSSDHLQPWLRSQGESGFLWSWLGSALQATQHLSFGAITVPCGWRYHPVIVAQAIATVCSMYPGRVPWIAFGSGEALNEGVMGRGWPPKSERNQRLQQGCQIIRELLSGASVTQSAGIITDHARLWTRPTQPPLLIGAAVSAATACSMADWADGLLTTAMKSEDLAAIIAAFRQRAPHKPVHAKIDLSWATSEDLALTHAYEQWRYQCLSATQLQELKTPEEFEQASSSVRPQDLRDAVLVSADLTQQLQWLQQRARLGVDSIDLHNVGPNQHEFIEAFGTHVLPALRAM
jgi:probable non-F420 flavinoid oxidoreductase